MSDFIHILGYDNYLIQGNLRDRVNRDLVSLSVSFMYGRVVAVLVRDEVSSFDVAAVGVFAFSVKDFFVELDVVVVDGIVEGDGDHLGHVLGG